MTRRVDIELLDRALKQKRTFTGIIAKRHANDDLNAEAKKRFGLPFLALNFFQIQEWACEKSREVKRA